MNEWAVACTSVQLKAGVRQSEEVPTMLRLKQRNILQSLEEVTLSPSPGAFNSGSYSILQR